MKVAATHAGEYPARDESVRAIIDLVVVRLEGAAILVCSDRGRPETPGRPSQFSGAFPDRAILRSKGAP
jgi:hypothetical protein